MTRHSFCVRCVVTLRLNGCIYLYIYMYMLMLTFCGSFDSFFFFWKHVSVVFSLHPQLYLYIYICSCMYIRRYLSVCAPPPSSFRGGWWRWSGVLSVSLRCARFLCVFSFNAAFSLSREVHEKYLISALKGASESLWMAPQLKRKRTRRSVFSYSVLPQPCRSPYREVMRRGVS